MESTGAKYGPAAAVTVTAEGATRLPLVGSAAWKAEQLAIGNVRIPTSRTVETPAARSARSFSLGGVLRYWRWVRVGIALAVALSGVVRALTNEPGVVTIDRPEVVTEAPVVTMLGAPSREQISGVFVELKEAHYVTLHGAAASSVEGALRATPGADELVDSMETRSVVAEDGSGSVAVTVATARRPITVEDPIERAYPCCGGNITGGGVGSTPGHAFNYWLLTLPDGYQMVWWDDDGFIISVVGDNRDHVHDFGTDFGMANEY
ncbi:MAG: hypothetical protein QOG54_783 [Actinomycetota bacterium]|jgi:hypothetical protein|nr:hypothetical protein [Actinomycetota bacterium]